MNLNTAQKLMYAAEARWINLDHTRVFPFRSYAILAEEFGPSEDECYRLRAFNRDGEQVAALLTAKDATEMEKVVAYPHL